MDHFLYRKEISIDDAGWDDLVLGVVIGAHKLPEHKYMDRRIPVSCFQSPNFENKQYLDEFIKIAEQILEVMRPDEKTRFKVCSGYILSSIRDYLERKNFFVERVEITGKLQELVETSYVSWCEEVGIQTENILGKRRFKAFLEWIKENHTEREKLVET